MTSDKTVAAEPAAQAPAGAAAAWMYLAPMAVFMLLNSLEGSLPQGANGPHPTWYPLFYTFKMAAVVAALVLSRKTLCDLKPWPGPAALALAVGIGIAVTVGWVSLERFVPYHELERSLLPKSWFEGSRQAFNPFVLAPTGRYAFLAVRLLGLVLLVPIMEELFWRSFLVRWLIDPDFQRVPIGKVTTTAAVFTSVMFAAAHPEWLPALLTGFAWIGLLWKTKSVSACVVSHAVANLGLGLYVLKSGDWMFW